VTPRRWAAALCFALCAGCSSNGPAPTASPTGARPSPSTSPTPAPTAVLIGAGDIATCSTKGDEETAALLDRLTGTVATFGDNAYDKGSARDFAECYALSWGRHKARTRPAPGNHDYDTRGAAGYFAYFGTAAGKPGRGYYSYELGAWHVVSLNSNCSVISCAAGSAQETWLRADLASRRNRCALAYWHHPRYTSGRQHGPDLSVRPLFRALHELGADVVLAGHNHQYERFAPMDADDQLDVERGIRSFVVGTGGAKLYDFGPTRPGSEARGRSWGVLSLTLRPEGYDWQFVPVAGNHFDDRGSARCH